MTHARASAPQPLSDSSLDGCGDDDRGGVGGLRWGAARELGVRAMMFFNFTALADKANSEAIHSRGRLPEEFHTEHLLCAILSNPNTNAVVGLRRVKKDTVAMYYEVSESIERKWERDLKCKTRRDSFLIALARVAGQSQAVTTIDLLDAILESGTPLTRRVLRKHGIDKACISHAWRTLSSKEREPFRTMESIKERFREHLERLEYLGLPRSLRSLPNFMERQRKSIKARLLAVECGYYPSLEKHDLFSYRPRSGRRTIKKPYTNSPFLNLIRGGASRKKD